MIEHTPLQADPAEKPLAGVRVLDLTHAYSGPFCTMHLADQGAEVIKLEAPGHGDQSRGWTPFKNGSSGYFAYYNRNKYGLALDLKSPEGKELFKRLAAESDVVCENFRVGTMEKLGLGYDVLKEINPGLIYASISGFGLEGPRSRQPSYDIIAQAMGGVMGMTGFDGRPTKVGPAIADNYSGTYLALGVAMALYQRSRTGMGRRLDVSMVDSIFSILDTGVVEYTVGGHIPEPAGNRDACIAPFDSFDAADGSFVLACGTDGFFRSLCEQMGRPALAEDPRFVSNEKRCEYYGELKPLINDWTRTHTVEDLEKRLVGAGIPFGRILNVEQVCRLDEIRDRNMLWTVHDTAIGEDIQIPGTPIKMHGCDDAPARPAPVVGEHTAAILKDILHLEDSEITELREKGVI